LLLVPGDPGIVRLLPPWRMLVSVKICLWNILQLLDCESNRL